MEVHDQKFAWMTTWEDLNFSYSLPEGHLLEAIAMMDGELLACSSAPYVEEADPCLQLLFDCLFLIYATRKAMEGARILNTRIGDARNGLAIGKISH